jgi:hypothetical protein
MLPYRCYSLFILYNKLNLQQVQIVSVKLYAVVNPARDFSNEKDHSFLGENYFNLAELINSSDQKVSMNLLNAKGSGLIKGEILVRGFYEVDTTDKFCVTFSADDLPTDRYG